VETTLSGKSFARTIQIAKLAGYAVAIQMVFVDSPFASVERVARRVRSGGHDVPRHDILRRFPRSLSNFWNIYRPLADRWLIAYNSGQVPISVATFSEDGYNVQDEGLLRKFFELGEITNDF
jgi:predicted ABC-type ATPase